MLSDIQRPVGGAMLKPLWRSVVGAYSPPEVVFPDKVGSYFTDFSGVANATKLRDLPGWAAYNSASLVHAARDKWVINSNATTRDLGSDDYDPAPGKFIVGRELATDNQIFRAKLVTIPNNATSIFMPFSSSSQTNSLMFTCQNSSGVMQNLTIQKNVGGTITSVLSQNGDTSPLGRKLQSGDTIEVHCLDTKVHLFINNERISPPGGSDIGTFTKGRWCGFGTGQGLGTVLDDIYMADITASISVADIPIFTPGSLVLGGRAVPLNGTYAGDVQALDYRVVRASDLAPVTAWARVQNPIISAGVWSASPFVPMSNIVTSPKVRVQIRVANDKDAFAMTKVTAVGITAASYGQSNSFYRGLGLATSHAVSNAYTWSAEAGSEWQGGAPTTISRSQLWATKVSEATGIPCGVVVSGVGSATLESLISTHWPATLDKLTTSQAAGYVAYWLWTQGEAEASGNNPFNVTQYRADFDTLLGILRGNGVSASQSAPVGVCVIGRQGDNYHGGGVALGNSQWSTARATLFGLTDKPSVVISSGLNDAIQEDALHYTADAYVEDGRRAGLSMSKAMGYGGHDGRGPIVTSASRVGAVVTLSVDLNGATSISGTGLTNYDVSVDGFVSTLPVSTVVVAGSTIVITLASDPMTAVSIRSFWGMTYTSPVRAIGTYANGTTIPVEPLYVAVTSN